MSIITEASATVSAENQWAEISYVPSDACVAISFSGVNGHTVKLQAKWNQAGAYEDQRSWTADLSEAVHFNAPRACSLRLGVPTGGFGTGSVPVKIGFDYPVRRAR